jgi:hypothetical protein
MAPLQPSHGLFDLPTELLLLIFEPLRPIQSTEIADLCLNSMSNPLMLRITEHNHAVKLFADIRLLCSTANQVIIPIAYEEVFLCIRETTRLDAMVEMFERNGSHIKSITICCAVQSREAEQAIGRGLRFCSQLNNLDCCDSRGTFTSRRWLAKTAAPCLATTITSLLLCPGRRKANISHSLVGLGHRIRRLDIIKWHPEHQNTPFHLPSEMPNLTHVVLLGGAPHVEDLKKLFKRIVNKRASRAERVPLRSVSLSLNLLGDDVVTILSINNLSLQLTSLVLCSILLYPKHAVSIVKACPKLINFSFAPWCTDKEIFNHLPRGLQHLQLSAFSERFPRSTASANMISSASDFIPYLTSGRCPVLRTLSVMKWGTDFELNDDLVKSTCDGLNIALHFRSIS